MDEPKPLGAKIHMTATCIDNFISDYLSKHFNSEMTAMEGMTLKFIYKAGKPVSARDIMNFTSLSKATTSQTLSSMVKKGLIVMKEKESDKRAKTIELTSKGHATIDEFCSCFEDITRICEEGFTPEERTHLTYLLEKMRNNVSIERK
jgi:DNA-binding MarR family transcriptional regulator